MRGLLVAVGVHIDGIVHAGMAQDGIVHRRNGVGLAAGLELCAQALLAAGCRPVSEDGQRPCVVHQCTGHGRIVDVHGLAFLDVVATGNAVVRIEEPGIDAGKDILPFRAPSGTDFRQGLTEILAVVVVRVGVRIGNLLVGIGGGEFDVGVTQVYLQHMHVAGHTGPGIMAVLDAGVKLFLFHNLPVVVGILCPVQRIVLQVIGAGGVYGRGVNSGPSVHGTVTGIAGELVGRGVVGAAPGRAEAVRGDTRNGTVVGAARDGAFVVTDQSGYPACEGSADGAVIHAGLSFRFGVSQQRGGIGLSANTAHAKGRRTGGYLMRCLVGDSGKRDADRVPDNAADAAGGVPPVGDDAFFGTKDEVGNPGIPGIADETCIRILLGIHGPGHVFDGMSFPVKGFAKRVLLCPYGNPFPDGGSIDIVQERHFSVYHKGTHGATAIHGRGKGQEIRCGSDSFYSRNSASGNLDEFHGLFLPAQGAHPDRRRTRFGQLVLRNGDLDGNLVFGTGPFHRQQTGPGLVRSGHPVFGTEHAE